MSEAFVRNVFALLAHNLMGHDPLRRLGDLHLARSFRQRATPNAVVDGAINLRAAHANVVELAVAECLQLGDGLPASVPVAVRTTPEAVAAAISVSKILRCMISSSHLAVRDVRRLTKPGGRRLHNDFRWAGMGFV